MRNYGTIYPRTERRVPIYTPLKVVPWVLPSVKKFVAFGYIKDEEKRGEGLR